MAAQRDRDELAIAQERAQLADQGRDELLAARRRDARAQDRIARGQRGEVARDEMATVFLHALLSTGKYEPAGGLGVHRERTIQVAVDVAVEAADALLARLHPDTDGSTP